MYEANFRGKPEQAGVPPPAQLREDYSTARLRNSTIGMPSGYPNRLGQDNTLPPAPTATNASQIDKEPKQKKAPQP